MESLATHEQLHIFGIRHHGPGCARSLRAALVALEPDIVLVEGPPDAEAVLPLLMHEEMQPPVALLIYAPNEPKHAVYYPFTHFSPEWQALRYAFIKAIPARFMDLPQAIQLARPAREDKDEGKGVMNAAPTEETVVSVVDDPLAMLAEAAGYSDHEMWWEQQVEQRQDATGLFVGILEAMSALRADSTPKNEEEAQREAAMRQSIRAAQKEGFSRIAVVCGAWHAPVLTNPGPAQADATLLSGLKRIKVEATWVPWTNSRLSYRSGYGAGVASPGWYEHLWTAPNRIAIRWITQAAQLLRMEGLDASSASVIEAVRLSEAVAAMRDLPMPGMAELHEAIETVLCHGDATPMQLIRARMEIGEKLGEVPATTPTVPLQRDLELKQRRLRLKSSAEITQLDLDLRNETDRSRSQLFHQLHLLGIAWGKPLGSSNKKGTFHELWQVQWQVEFAVSLIEANIWGNTVESAATAFARHSADNAQDLPSLTALLDRVILAELSDATDYLLQMVQQRAAVSADVRHLMGAMPPLARVARYGNVRQTKAERILPIIDGLFERILVGLPIACNSLDDDTATAMLESIDAVQESVSLLNRDEQQGAWQHTLYLLMERESIHGLVRGRCCRLLLEQRVLDERELQRQARLALATANPAAQAAAWIAGILRGSGHLVLYQDGLWRALDRWLCDLPADIFEAQLPLLRRAFSGFQPPERRAMGEKVKHLHTLPTMQAGNVAETTVSTLNEERANMTLPLLAQILGARLP